MSEHRAKITEGTGVEAYDIIVTASSMRPFKRAARCQDIQGKEGEALVDALVKLGGIDSVERYKNGWRNDGPYGEPCEVVYFTNGDVYAVSHYNAKTDDASFKEIGLEGHFSRAYKHHRHLTEDELAIRHAKSQRQNRIKKVTDKVPALKILF